MGTKGIRCNFKDLTGHRYGHLVVVGEAARSPAGKIRWNCRCDCGGVSVVLAGNLRKGHTVSCGCAWRKVIAETKKTHGLSSTPEYTTWASAKQRCFDPANKRWNQYGGKGVTMCERWRTSAEAFIADMGKRPSANYSIDRIDVNGNYSCGKCKQCIDREWTANCRWASPVEQQNNKTSNRKYEFRGEIKSVKEIAEIVGMSASCLKQRLSKHGWRMEDAVSLPPHAKRPLHDADLAP